MLRVETKWIATEKDRFIVTKMTLEMLLCELSMDSEQIFVWSSQKVSLYFPLATVF